ncbi:MAG TPA: DUF692 family protein [Trueperaceae bacterium]
MAVNDMPLARHLLAANRLPADRLETSGPQVESAVTGFPDAYFLLHNSVWDWSLSHPNALEQKDALECTRRRLEQTRAPFLSIHLGFSAAQVAFRDGMQRMSPILAGAELLDHVVRNARELASLLEVPLLLENLDFNPTGAYDHICEPAFIHEAVTRADVFFLLDLAHAQVSASRLGYKLEDYLAALPLDRVRQLHLSGPRDRDGTLWDAHEPLREEDYALLHDILKVTEPWSITLEYGKDEEELLGQLERLRAML